MLYKDQNSETQTTIQTLQQCNKCKRLSVCKCNKIKKIRESHAFAEKGGENERR